MNRKWLVALVLCVAGTAHAQDEGITVSVGARAWYTDWSTFSYFTSRDVTPVPLPGPSRNLALTQSTADEKFVLMPLVSARYRNFVASMSAFPSKDFSLTNGFSPAPVQGERNEFDLNVGYYVLPTLAVTLGYKKIEQSERGGGRYRPRGPILGINASAPLHDAWSLYGNLGIGWLETPGGDPIKFDAQYRLTEVGVAYTLNGSTPRQWTLTAGYRFQVLRSKDAIPDIGIRQDGRDTTQGFAIGAIATF